MRRAKSCDVLIVGAGPAGSSAARAAAEVGADVLVIEKRKKIGEPVQCAEYIPRLLTQEVKIPPKAIAQEIQGMTTFLPNGEILRKLSPGYILNRAEFDRALATAASSAGAELLMGTRALSKRDEMVMTMGPSGETGIEAQVVIGADGPNSQVGSWIGRKNKKLMFAVQHTVQLKHASFDTEVYFSREYPGGYAWLFPKGKYANVGVGVIMDMGGLAKRALETFKQRVKTRIGEVIGATAGFIPVGGPLPSVDEQARIMLAGDAAGHVHAITGGGIPQAVICGAMAGRAAADYVFGDQSALQRYSEEWRKTFGNVLYKAAEKRKELETGWEKRDLTELTKRCWIACRGYYDDP